MIGPNNRDVWMAIVCDTASAALLAVRGTGSSAQRVQQRCIELDADDLQQRGRSTGLEQFVADHQLSGSAVRVAFAGAGCIVQKLHMPPLSTRNRNRAIRTRLSNYASGRQLAIGIRLDGPPAREAGAQVLAAGVDCALTRGLYRACRRVGLRVQWMTALADVFGAPPGGGTLIQLLLGERTSTLQLFDAERLIGCRDVLLGRRDFVAAYQRPILTASGPVTLSAAEAEALAGEVGIPVGREDEVRPGLPAVQLWPMLTPVLQKLRREIEQSLTHSQVQAPVHASLRILGAPTLPGLAEFLADDLQLQTVPQSPAAAELDYLAAWCASGRKHERMDLRPPEERFGDRFTRPALTAGLCALLVILGNSAAPREAGARLAELRPLAEQLQSDAQQAQQEYSQARGERDGLVAQLHQRLQLAKVLPRRMAVVELVQRVLDSVPPEVELVDVQVQADTAPTSVALRAVYQGPVAASVVAGHWARGLSQSEPFAGARVTAVSGSGRETPAFVELEAQFK
jgi:hypothetical protein